MSAKARRRLDELEASGCSVVGPVPAEDTAGRPGATSSRPEGQGHSVAVTCPTASGESRTVTGHGRTPDEAALAAVSQLDPAGGG